MRRQVEILSENVVGLHETLARQLIEGQMHTAVVLRRDKGLFNVGEADRSGLRIVMEVDRSVVTKARPG